MTIGSYRHDQNKIVVLNPKGGCGKTTLATNLASYFALRGPPPTLIDTDPQGYTARWLARRPDTNNRIISVTGYKLAVQGNRSWPFRMPRDAGAVIVDTPAGLTQREIAELTRDADCILVPVLPSAFDVHVTVNFIARLLMLTQLEVPVAVVANRTQRNTLSLAKLLRVLNELETPTIAVLRSSQNYVQAADLGIGIYEMPPYRVNEDVEQMDQVIAWLDRRLMKSLEPGLMSRLNPLPRLFATSGTSA